MKQLSLKRFSLRQIHATSYKDSHTAKLSMTVLYTIVAAALTVFVLFFTVGYDRAFEENADFNAPMLTDALLMTLYLLTDDLGAHCRRCHTAAEAPQQE